MKYERMNRMARLAPLALAMALAGGYATAQTTGSTSSGTSTESSVTGAKSAPAAQAGTGARNSPDKSQVAKRDRKFMDEAAGGSMFEVEAGKLAQSKSTNPDVKSMGEKLVADHSAANDELMKLANSKSVDLPAAPTHGDRNELEKLGKLSGDKFDKEFAKVAVKDHKKDIKKFESESGKVKDPELKAWIDKTLPTLREHLAMAQKLESGEKNGAAAMGNRGTSDMSSSASKGAATGTNTGTKTGS